MVLELSLGYLGCEQCQALFALCAGESLYHIKRDQIRGEWHVLDNRILEKISYVKDAKNMIELTKGFSDDKKYVIDGKYLLRLFSLKNVQHRKAEFDTIKKLAAYSDYIPNGISFHSLEDSDMACMVLTYLPGNDADEALKDLTADEQYVAGVFAGKELIKLHQLAAPEDYPSWYELKKKKSDNYIRELMKINVDEKIKKELVTYIKENEVLMKDRPNRFQHDDFHPSNILIRDKKFSGIIDFGRMDWGDPIHDLQKLGFFSKQVSIDFTNGIIDGYHGNQPVGNTFWKLYTLYSVIHIVSALVWGKRNASEQYELLLKYSLEVIRDHDHFKLVIPKWYNKRN